MDQLIKFETEHGKVIYLPVWNILNIVDGVVTTRDLNTEPKSFKVSPKSLDMIDSYNQPTMTVIDENVCGRNEIGLVSNLVEDLPFDSRDGIVGNMIAKMLNENKPLLEKSLTKSLTEYTAHQATQATQIGHALFESFPEIIKSLFTKTDIKVTKLAKTEGYNIYYYVNFYGTRLNGYLIVSYKKFGGIIRGVDKVYWEL